jgi:predicted metal-dependent hydrolase
MSKESTEVIQIQEIPITITWKEIKNVHLSVIPPKGNVRISAPLKMKRENIRAFAISKLDWIRKNQLKFKNQNREPSREYIEKESHYLLGTRYLLKIEESKKSSITIQNSRLLLQVPKDTKWEKKKQLFTEYYRQKLLEVVEELVSKWIPLISVPEFEISIRIMKTRWGTCHPSKKKIWLNLELAKKPIPCIEYVLVHEMVHLLEKNHSKRFIRNMDRYIPTWRELKMELNNLPIHGVSKTDPKI